MMMVPSSSFQQAENPKTLKEILGSTLVDPALSDLPIKQLHLDSRQVQKGDGFIALKGELYDGKTFIGEAFKKGAAVVLVDASEVAELESDEDFPIVPVQNLIENLSRIADNLYHHPSAALSVVGITGTNGKTSCVQFYAQAIALLSGLCGVVGTTGFGVFEASKNRQKITQNLTATGMTTPDPIAVQKILAQFVQNKVSRCAMEVSSHGLVQHRVAAVTINTAVFTNLSHDHLDYHQTMEAYGEAKAQLFVMPSVKHAVINSDDAFATTLLGKLADTVKTVTYGFNAKPLSLCSDLHLSVQSIEMIEPLTTQVHLLAETVNHSTAYTFNTSLLGQFNISNLLAVIGSLYAEGFALEKIINIVQDIKPIDGRMELIESEVDVSVVVDFAHTPDALKKALDALKASSGGALWCVFGCGGDRDKAKRQEMAKIAEASADHVIITSDNPRTESPEAILADIAKGFSSQKYSEIVDREKAIAYVIEQASKNDTVLIAGKGHETYQIIGKEKHYFSDQEQAKAALLKRKKGAGND